MTEMNYLAMFFGYALMFLSGLCVIMFVAWVSIKFVAQRLIDFFNLGTLIVLLAERESARRRVKKRGDA